MCLKESYPDLYFKLKTYRQDEAIAMISNFLNGNVNMNVKIVLVFGAAHNFLQYNDKELGLEFVVPEQFEKSIDDDALSQTSNH